MSVVFPPSVATDTPRVRLVHISAGGRLRVVSKAGGTDIELVPTLALASMLAIAPLMFSTTISRPHALTCGNRNRW